MSITSEAPPHRLADFLRPPNINNVPSTSSTRDLIPSTSFPTYQLTTKAYQQQFNDMYFLRLSALKPILTEIAESEWSNYFLGSNRARSVPRVLDVRQGEVCWVIGTIYLDMPLKPNVLDDIAKDHSLVAPPTRERFCEPGVDRVMLEDESGRLILTGIGLENEDLVTGVVVAVLGLENSEGEFQVLNIRNPDLAPMRKVEVGSEKGKVVVASGLGIYGDLQEKLGLHLFSEWLLGEAGGEEDQAEAATISRLIIAGNSLGTSQNPITEMLTDDAKIQRAKKYGYDAKSYNPVPITHLDGFLSTLLPSIPITLIPGPTDPANVSYPQQPFHPALFRTAKSYDTTTLTRATNPWSGTIGTHTFLVTSGQNLDDIFHYFDTDTTQRRLDMCEKMLRWRVVAPTAPDTLCSYPMRETDPFVMTETPRWFIVGNQKEFAARTVESADGNVRCTVVLVPSFEETGMVLVVDLGSGELGLMRFAAEVDGV